MEKDLAFLKALTEFKDAAIRLSVAWDEADHTGDLYAHDYPFAHDFDTVVLEIKEWHETQHNTGK
jgi:hypothetical protein